MKVKFLVELDIVEGRNLDVDCAARSMHLLMNQTNLNMHLGQAIEGIKITPTNNNEEIGTLKGLLSMVNCPDCDGSGCMMHQVSEAQYISKYMAMDAGDMDLEGQLFSEEEWEQEQCRWCYEKKRILGNES